VSAVAFAGADQQVTSAVRATGRGLGESAEREWDDDEPPKGRAPPASGLRERRVAYVANTSECADWLQDDVAQRKFEDTAPGRDERRGKLSRDGACTASARLVRAICMTPKIVSADEANA